MINMDDLKKTIEDYRNDLKMTIESRDKMIQMVNQYEVKIQQLLGAISALETILGKKEEPTDAASKDSGEHAESKDVN